jgi:hypothetical protein
MAKELKNQQSLMQQISEKRSALSPVPTPARSLTLAQTLTLTLTLTLTRSVNKHAMTPLEATLNRELLLSIASGKAYEPTSIMD